MEVVSRLPACPKCHEAGVHIKGEMFRCSDRMCGEIWVEVGWQDRLDNEASVRVELERIRDINIIVSLGFLTCDECGREIRMGQTYVIDAKDMSRKNPANTSLRAGADRAKRYCQFCAARKEYLQLIETSSGARFFARKPDVKERVVSKALGIKEVKLILNQAFPVQTCPACGEPMIQIPWDDADGDKKHKQFIIACDNWGCSRFRTPQGWVDLKKATV